MDVSSKLTEKETDKPSTSTAIQSESVASSQSIPSGDEENFEKSDPPKEIHSNSVAETNGPSLNEGKGTEKTVIVSAQNPTSANSTIALDRDLDENVIIPLVNYSANGESNAVTKEFNSEHNSNFDRVHQKYAGQGMLGISNENIEEVEPLLYNGALIPCVGVPSDLLPSVEDPNVFKYSIPIPIWMLGLLYGSRGKNSNYLKEKYQVELYTTFWDSNSAIVELEISCPREFAEEVMRWILDRIKSGSSDTPIGNPNQLQRALPLGRLTRVFVRSSYARKHLYVTIADEKYSEFLDVQKEITADYSDNTMANSWLNEPICATTVVVLKTGDIYSRVCIIGVVLDNPKYAICFLLDHGIFTVAPVTDLRKIRARYMETSFQAVSVMWAHARPSFETISDDTFLMQYFNNNRLYVFPVRNETCCRSDAIFFMRIDDPETGSTCQYQDILVQAVNDGHCRFAGKVIYPDEQRKINNSETAYYFCPFSDVYKRLVLYQMPNGDIVGALDVPIPRPLPQLGNQQQHGRSELGQNQQGRQSANQRRRNRRPNAHRNPENGGN